MTFDFNRIPWKDVVAMAADVARNGFNVTHDFGKYRVIYRTNCLVWNQWGCFFFFNLICLPFVLSTAEALANVKSQNMSAAFRDLFLPKDQVPLTGQFTRRLDLAAVLDAVAVKGISEFYSGNVAQKMASAVRINIFFHQATDVIM